jgi:hypothetical protein
MGREARDEIGTTSHDIPALASPPIRLGSGSEPQIPWRNATISSSSVDPPALGTRYETSPNWSGAYITPKRSRMFTEVHGSWQVPTPSPPVDGKGSPPADGDYRSSAWIGLDGQRRYLNSSLPQIGTSQFVKVVDDQPTPDCQRRRENASAGRSKNASRMDARRPPAGGFFCFLAVDVGKDGWQCL